MDKGEVGQNFIRNGGLMGWLISFKQLWDLDDGVPRSAVGLGMADVVHLVPTLD